MKFSILSGAYVNAGDFLIVDRCIKLIKNVFPDCEVNVYERRKSLENKIEELNNSDAIILAGGPAYLPNLYPETIPLVNNLEDITTKIIAIGLGWYGKQTDDLYLYEQYKFNDSTKRLLERIIKDSGYLTCRDWYTTRVLRANGFDKVLMTGCPAWYNLQHINEKELRSDIHIPFKKICISDPANSQNLGQALDLSKYIKNKFNEANITFVFHRIENKDNNYQVFRKQIEELGIETQDISNSADGFSAYDDCDLHIGYRVHAHIYNLSNRNISILIEEDGRGAGVNQAMGLPNITAYMDNASKVPNKTLIGKGVRLLERKLFKIDSYKSNQYIFEELEDYFTMLFNNNFSFFQTAFFNLQTYYQTMENYIRNSMIEEKGRKDASE